LIPIFLQELYNGIAFESTYNTIISIFHVVLFYEIYFISVFKNQPQSISFSYICKSFLIGEIFRVLGNNIGIGKIYIGEIFILILLVVFVHFWFISKEMEKDYVGTPIYAKICSLMNGIKWFTIFFSISWIINHLFLSEFLNIRRDLKLNLWISSTLKFLNETSNPLKWIDWSNFIEAAERFDFSNKDVMYVDSFCFPFTFLNLVPYILFFYIYYSYYYYIASFFYYNILEKCIYYYYFCIHRGFLIWEKINK